MLVAAAEALVAAAQPGAGRCLASGSSASSGAAAAAFRSSEPRWAPGLSADSTLADPRQRRQQPGAAAAAAAAAAAGPGGRMGAQRLPGSWAHKGYSYRLYGGE
jgi:hypothetical protein